MFKSKKIITSDVTNTVIGEGIRIDASRLSGLGSLRIDGEFSGEIDIDGELILGESGRIIGNIKARQALLAGKVEGNVTCRASVHVTHSASLLGNVIATALIVDEGAVFNGNCQMSSTALGMGSIHDMHDIQGTSAVYTKEAM